MNREARFSLLLCYYLGQGVYLPSHCVGDILAKVPANSY